MQVNRVLMKLNLPLGRPYACILCPYPAAHGGQVACEQSVALRVTSAWMAAIESSSVAASPDDQPRNNVPQGKQAEGVSSNTISPAGCCPSLESSEAARGDGGMLSLGTESMHSSVRFAPAVASDATGVSVCKLGFFRCRHCAPLGDVGRSLIAVDR